MKKTVLRLLSLLLSLLVLPLLPVSLSGCAGDPPACEDSGGRWRVGFGSAEIPLPEDGPLYIAGYHGGREIDGVHDLQRANAVWMQAGRDVVLLISVDCVGLSGATIDDVRASLADFCRRTGCPADHVCVSATHDHAGIDTLGLWGDTAMNGKNDAFMDNLIAAAVTAAQAAYEARRDGTLSFGSVVTEGLLRDSRDPQVVDPTLYRLRFTPDDGTAGVILCIFGAHAEAMRGANLTVSRDYPGVLADTVKERTGDDLLFLPGAVGGLVMTRELTEGAFDAEENCRLTGIALADALLSVTPDAETLLTPRVRLTREDFDVPLDNTLFLYYRFLGILENRMHAGGRGQGSTGYRMTTSVSVLSLGEKTLALLPGEIFPELVTGEGLTADDPEPLAAVAARYGVTDLIVTGLCNDEIGYIIPPSDYVIDDKLPFIVEGHDAQGVGHYEETNCVGKDTAACLSAALSRALEKHTSP